MNIPCTPNSIYPSFIGIIYRVFVVVLLLMSVQSKEEGNDQESIQSNTTPDLEHHMGKWQKHKKTSHTREPRGQPFPSTRLQGTWLIRNTNNKKDPYQKHCLGTIWVILLGGFNMFDGTNLTLYSDVDQDKNRCFFAWNIPNLSICHLQVNTNRDIKRR